MITMDQSSERAVQEPVAFDVEITGDGFKLAVPLPGYSAVEITVAMKQNRDLHVIADRWDLQANCA
jgi:HSP20 family molecular chaperone IbpA